MKKWFTNKDFYIYIYRSIAFESKVLTIVKRMLRPKRRKKNSAARNMYLNVFSSGHFGRHPAWAYEEVISIFLLAISFNASKNDKSFATARYTQIANCYIYDSRFSFVLLSVVVIPFHQEPFLTCETPGRAEHGTTEIMNHPRWIKQ